MVCCRSLGDISAMRRSIAEKSTPELHEIRSSCPRMVASIVLKAVMKAIFQRTVYGPVKPIAKNMNPSLVRRYIF